MPQNDDQGPLPQDIAEAGRGMVEKLQQQAQAAQGGGMIEGLIEAFGGAEEFASFTNELDQQIKAILPPDLVAELDAVEKELAALNKTGESVSGKPYLALRLNAVMSHPAYIKAMDEAMGGFMNVIKEDAAERPADDSASVIVMQSLATGPIG